MLLKKIGDFVEESPRAQFQERITIRQQRYTRMQAKEAQVIRFLTSSISRKHNKTLRKKHLNAEKCHINVEKKNSMRKYY